MADDIIVPKKVLESMRTIVGYNWRDEEKHYMEYEDKEEASDHIFLHLQKVDNFLDINDL